MKEAMSGISRRGERILFCVATTMFAGTSVCLAAVMMKLIRRHGETLLELESLRSSGVPAQPQSNLSQLVRDGAPPGSVAMNFELPAIDGTHYTFTSLKRDRTLLIFIAPDCDQSRALLKSLSELKMNLDSPRCRIALISSGTFNENLRLAREFGLDIPLLVQEGDEVYRLYFVTGTPMAYLIGRNSMSETGRIEGAQAILGVAIAALNDFGEIPNGRVIPTAPHEPPWPNPLHAGDEIPEMTIERLDQGVITREDFLGRRTLLLMFDPTCGPCMDLLPDLKETAASGKLNVIMVTRREPAQTREIATTHGLTFPIGIQDNWEISRRIGAVAVPAACIIDPDGYLESDVVAGRQAIYNLMSRTRTGPMQRKLVSLTTFLRGR